MSLLVYLPAAFIAFVILRLIPYIWIAYKSRDIPGPPCSFFLGNTPLKNLRNPAKALAHLHGAAAETLASGENLLRMRLYAFIITVPLNGEALKPLLDSSEEITKGLDYEIMHPWMGDGLLFSTGSKWKSRRRLLTPSFHFSILQGYSSLIDRHARVLVDILEEKGGNDLDIYECLRMCALDIICDTSMSYDLGAQRDPHQPYVKALAKYNRFAALYPMNLHMHLKIVWALFYMRKFNGLIIQHKLAEDVDEDKSKRKAFLDTLIEHHRNGELTLEDIREEVDTFMFAGHDTTSSGMTWTLWCLATNPEEQKIAYDEVNSIFGDSDRDCTMDDIKEMHYVERCIKESMRVFPPVTLVERRLHKDFKIGPHTVPATTNIYISPSVVHNNAQDVRRFDPDRFLPENASKRHPYDYIPFSAGARNCIGQKFAMIEMKVVVSWVLRRFVLGASVGQEDVATVPEVILRPAKRLPISFTPR